MAGRPRITTGAIVGQAQRIVAGQGISALTFQSVAAALGVSKQAVIYWYPSKWELLRDVAVTGLQAESAACIAAVGSAHSAAEAIGRFVRALVAHHLADLGGFRVLYLAIQFDRPPVSAEGDELRPIHETTAAMYAALESRIAADIGFVGAEDPRRLAVATHMAAIGLLTMIALADAVDDPLAHRTESLVDSLVALLTGRRTS